MLFSEHTQPMVVISGLPRSGTSMMMRILEVGGILPLTDGIRVADLDNPAGYYEYERVKKLKSGDTSWLRDAHGKAVKVISSLLQFLPDGYDYQVIFMRRNISEILASQRQMLINRGENPDAVSDAQLAAYYENHLKQIEIWLKNTDQVQFVCMDYNRMISSPEIQLKQIESFLGRRLNIEAMMAVIDPALYRQRC